MTSLILNLMNFDGVTNISLSSRLSSGPPAAYVDLAPPTHRPPELTYDDVLYELLYDVEIVFVFENYKLARVNIYIIIHLNSLYGLIVYVCMMWRFSLFFCEDTLDPMIMYLRSWIYIYSATHVLF